MANPNIVNVTTINGGNAGFNLTATTTATLMTVSGSGVIVKVNRITVANVDGSAAADVDLFIDGLGSGATGVTTTGADATVYLAKTISGTWGTKTNANLSLIEQLTGGYNSQAVTDSGTPTALTIADGALTGTAQHRVIELTGSITGARVVTVPLLTENFYFIKNSTSGSYTVQVKSCIWFRCNSNLDKC